MHVDATDFKDMRDDPAEIYAIVVGLSLTVAGLVGFLYSSDFGDPGKVDGVLGVLDVNGWHNVIHLLSGAVGIAAFASGLTASRFYALAFGLVYTVIAVWGFVIGDGGSILGAVPVNTEDSVLHLIIGLGGIAALLASRPSRGSGPDR